MRHRIQVVASISAILAAAITTAFAQGTDPRPVLYRLQRNATTFEHGCFPPCLCPMMQTAYVRGTFKLTPTGYDGLYYNYDVTEVRWKVLRSAWGGEDVLITGSGTYRNGGEVAQEHQLELDLKVGDDPIEHFDSGLVAGGGEFPRIHIDISIHGRYCFDTAIDVHARPLMRMAVGRGSVSWDAAPDATGYDAVRGNLGTLRNTDGDFTAATVECLAANQEGNVTSFDLDPASGEAFWFVAREITGSADDTYDADDAGQVGSRNAGIDASTAACP